MGFICDSCGLSTSWRDLAVDTMSTCTECHTDIETKEGAIQRIKKIAQEWGISIVIE